MAVKINGSTGITFEDNDKQNWGTGADLEIYHDASNSYIDETGTGSLILRASPSIEFRKAGSTEKMLYAEPDAQVELYYDNSVKFHTRSDGIRVIGDATWSDNGKARFGPDGDLEIYHDGSNNNSYIKDTNASGHLYVNGTNVYLSNAANDKDYITCVDGAAVTLKHNNATKLETTSGGVSITGDLTVSGSSPGGVTSDGQDNTVAGGNAGDSFTGTDAINNTLVGKDAGTAITSGDDNTALGKGALAAVTTASWNTAIGTGAGTAATSERNVFIGSNCATAAVTGVNNTAVGQDALRNNTSGQNQVAIGQGALYANTEGIRNTAVGQSALGANLTADWNVAVGAYTLDANTIGEENTALGAGALGQNTEGSEGVAIGYAALDANTTGNANVAVGFKALYENVSTTRNVAVGWGAAEANKDNDVTAVGYEAAHLNRFGARNTALGSKALINGYDYDDNTCVGYRAGQASGIKGKNVIIGSHAGYNSTSEECVFVGYNAGQGNTTGYYNTCIGHQAGYNLSTGVNITLLGFNAGTASSPSGVVDDDSNVFCLGNDNTDNLFCNDTSISSSDQRDKTDITNFTPGLSFIKQLRPVTYRWDKRSWYLTDKYVTQAQIDNGEYSETQLGSLIPATSADLLAATPDGSKKKPKQHVGFIAQEVLAVEQSAGFASDKNNMLTVNLTTDETQYGMKYERLVPILVNAIKELETRIATLEAA